MARSLPDVLDRWRTLRVDDLPPDVVTIARSCALDWLGCALAGSREPLAAILRDELVDDVVDRPGADGRATVVGSASATSPRTASLVNGAAGHALDFDDTHLLVGHPTAPVLPAVLATAEALDVDGGRLLSALVAGIEVECRMGALVGPGHYAAGWHTTGTLGTIGAAAAVANLLELDPVAWGHALGLATTMAAGLKASFGTMAKPLHAGKAAADGTLAARLAVRGFTANPDAMVAAQGLAAAAHGRADLDRLESLGTHWLIRDTLFKHHAACYLTHASINAAAALRDRRVGSVEGVEVRVAPGSLDACNIARPVTGLEGKFSLRVTVAMALLGRPTSDPAAYTDALVHDPAVVALRDRVTVTADDGLETTQSLVCVTTGDGRQLTAVDDTGRPAQDLARQAARLDDKFDALAAPVLGEAGAKAVREAVHGLGADEAVRALAAGLRLAP